MTDHYMVIHNVSNHICYHFIINLPAKELHVGKHITLLTLEHPSLSSGKEFSLCNDCFLLFQASQPQNKITDILNPRRHNSVICNLSKEWPEHCFEEEDKFWFVCSFSIRLVLLGDEQFICVLLPFSKELSDSIVLLQSQPLDVRFFFGRSLHGFGDLLQCFWPFPPITVPGVNFIHCDSMFMLSSSQHSVHLWHSLSVLLK